MSCPARLLRTALEVSIARKERYIMHRQRTTAFLAFFLLITALCGCDLGRAQSTTSKGKGASSKAIAAPSAECARGQMRCVTAADRAEAARRAAAARSMVMQPSQGQRPVFRPRPVAPVTAPSLRPTARSVGASEAVTGPLAHVMA